MSKKLKWGARDDGKSPPLNRKEKWAMYTILATALLVLGWVTYKTFLTP